MVTDPTGSGTLRFDGRVAVVTGAGRGLGRAYALALAKRGAAVVVNDLGTASEGGAQADTSPADETVALIRAEGASAIASHDDVSTPDGAANIATLAVEAFGGIDVLVNNAGIARNEAIETQAPGDFRAVLDTHLVGTWLVTRAAWPHMASRGYGRVVMTTSAVGLWGGPTGAAYAAAKAGTYGLARSLAQEGAPRGIAVNCIAPAAQTRLTAGSFTKPNARTWRPELVTPAVLYLAHESCTLAGEVIAAVAADFARVQVVQGGGHRFDPRSDLTLEDFVGELDEILSMRDARSFREGVFEALGLRNVRSTAAMDIN